MLPLTISLKLSKQIATSIIFNIYNIEKRNLYVWYNSNKTVIVSFLSAIN